MSARPRRRPSLATPIALLALFAAVGGPAEAAKLIRGSQIKSSTLTGRHIKNHSLRTVDISQSSIRALERTPERSVASAQVVDGSLTGADIADRSVGNADLAPNSVGPGKLVPNAVLSGELGDNSVDSAAVIDGVLLAKDVARFAGNFTLDIPSVAPQSCEALNPEGLAPQTLNVDIGNDLIVGSPPSSWPDQLTFSIRRAPATANRVRIVACNPTAAAVDPPAGQFRYAVFAL